MRLSPALLSSLLLATSALAEGPSAGLERPPHRLDLGLAAGFNTEGLLAVVSDLRLTDHLSVGAGVGEGLWGHRWSGHVRLYPEGLTHSGLFLEATGALNQGGFVSYPSEGPVSPLDYDKNQVATAAASIGYRFGLGSRGWLALQGGWAAALRTPEARLRTAASPSRDDRAIIDVSEPGGVVVGLSGGFSVF